MSDTKKRSLQFIKPAIEWFEALPLGNGSLGAMSYGGISQERISLNLDTLWSGTGQNKGNTKGIPDWELLRCMIKENKHKEAEQYILGHVLGDWTECYLPAGGLNITFLGQSEVDANRYQRELVLNDGLQTTVYEMQSTWFERELFVSIKEELMAMRISCKQFVEIPRMRVSMEISLDSPLQHVLKEVSVKELCIVGKAPVYAAPHYQECTNPIRYEEGNGIRFGLGIGVEQKGGILHKYDDRIRIEGAEEVVLYLSGATDFRDETESFATRNCCDSPAVSEDSIEGKINKALHIAYKKGYERLKQEHVAAFRQYFERVEFTLETGVPAQKEQKQSVQHLEELLFHYGRYLLIASSKPGSQCANLQGIWNEQMQAPWSSNYTVNINTEMNYWMAESCNLSEFHLPLFDLIKKTREQGRKTAKELYGLEGWVSHHNIDLWGHSTPVGYYSGNPAACGFGMWPMSSGWLCRHLWEHYEYTLDKEFLENTAYPIIEEAARFYLGYLVPWKNFMLTIPSTSPENQFLKENGEQHCVSLGSTMDISIIKDLFLIYIEICKVLGIQGISDQVDRMLHKLPPFQIGKYGQLQEWIYDYEDADVHHRHVSHLYGLYPANLITEEQEELRKACEVSLLRRGAEGTGWCCVWKACLWARLGNGEKAYELLRMMMRPTREKEIRMEGGGIYPNLFCAHPPFQIDGNFGFTAAITEMLLQSDGNEIKLLPAIPDCWKNGQVKGLKARGGYTVDFCWREGKVYRALVQSISSKDVILNCNGKEVMLCFGNEKTEPRCVGNQRTVKEICLVFDNNE